MENNKIFHSDAKEWTHSSQAYSLGLNSLERNTSHVYCSIPKWKNETLEILSKISLKLSDSIHLRRWCCTEHYDLKLNDWYTSWSGCTDRSAQYCIITFILQLMRIASVVQWTQRNYPTSIFESKKKRKENKRSIQSCGRRKFYQLKHVSCPAGKSKQCVRKISHVA